LDTPYTDGCRYDLGLIGGAILGITNAFHINDATKEAIVGAAKLGAFFGTFIGGVCMLRYGRRKAISLQAAFFVAGPALMAAAPGPA
jgi:MFS family permease